jgi:hypothetical protein
LGHLPGTPPLPANPKPRRFAFGVAAVWVMAINWAFLAGSTTVGYILGAMLTLIPAINVTLAHFCLFSLTYRWLFGRRLGRKSK